jgi:hypothetical protein
MANNNINRVPITTAASTIVAPDLRRTRTTLDTATRFRVITVLLYSTAG